MDQKTIDKLVTEVNMNMNKGFSHHLGCDVAKVKQSPVLSVTYDQGRFVVLLLILNRLMRIDTNLSVDEVGSSDEVVMQVLITLVNLIKNNSSTNQPELLTQNGYITFYIDCLLDTLETLSNHDLIFQELLNLDRDLNQQSLISSHSEVMRYEAGLHAIFVASLEQFAKLSLNGTEVAELETKKLLMDPTRLWVYLNAVLSVLALVNKDKATNEYLLDNPAVMAYFLTLLFNAQVVKKVVSKLYT